MTFKDKNLRKILWGYWYKQDRECGGAKFVLDNGRWEIDMNVGVVRRLLMEIDELKYRVRTLEERKK